MNTSVLACIGLQHASPQRCGLPKRVLGYQIFQILCSYNHENYCTWNCTSIKCLDAACTCLMLICNTYMLRRNAIANLQYLWAMLQGIQEYIHTVNWQYSLCLPTTLGAGELLLAT